MVPFFGSFLLQSIRRGLSAPLAQEVDCELRTLVQGTDCLCQCPGTMNRLWVPSASDTTSARSTALTSDTARDTASVSDTAAAAALASDTDSDTVRTLIKKLRAGLKWLHVDPMQRKHLRDL